MNLNDRKNIRQKELPSKGISTYTASLAASDANFLDSKLDYIKKELTQWDIYKISSVVATEEEFLSKYNNLLPNTALIVDANTFSRTLNNTLTNFSRGDIVYKTNDLSAIHLKAERGGNFYPSEIRQSTTENNNFIITYEFTPLVPTGSVSITPISSGSEKIWTVSSASGIPQQIQFNNMTLATNQSIYSIATTRSSNTYTFDAVSSGSNTIQPVIKTFANNNEEIYWDMSVVSAASQYTISNIPNIVSMITIK